MSKNQILVSTEEVGLRGMDLVKGVVDPEISKFSEWFASAGTGGSDLTPMEVELLRTYLYQKLTGGL